MAASFQRVAVEHLVERTARALGWAREAHPSLSCLVVAGGVAANQEVRRQLTRVASEAGLPMVCPPVRLCTDNGIMVAWTGMQRLRHGLADRPVSTSQAPTPQMRQPPPVHPMRRSGCPRCPRRAARHAAPACLRQDVSLFVEVRPRWPLGPRDPRSTTQQAQLSKRKRAPSAGQPTGGDPEKSGSKQQKDGA